MRPVNVNLPSRAYLLKTAVLAALFSSEKAEEQRVAPHKSILNEERFGKASEDRRRPLLNDRKGKGTRKSRSSLNAKLETRRIRQAKEASDYFEATKDMWNTEGQEFKEYPVSVTFNPKVTPSKGVALSNN